MELTATMLAQIVTTILGFLLFVWVMTKFAWRPILDHLEGRRDRINDAFDRIEREKVACQRREEELNERLRQIDEERRRVLAEAVAEGQQLRDEIQAKAQQEAAALLEKQKDQIQLEINKARVQIKEEVVAIVMDATERLLMEKLDAAKHRDLVGRFIDDIQGLGNRN